MTIPRVLAWPLFILPWAAAVTVVAWLLLLRFPPNGISHLSFVFDGSSPWLDAFLPGERVTPAGSQKEGWIGQQILQDPVYASARLPGVYDRVALTLEAKSIRQPLLELGLLRDPEAFAFEMHPVWSEVLSHGWRRVEHGSVQGFVKEGEPDSMLETQDFDRLLVWHATGTSPARMDQPGAERTVDVSLRGAHDFFVIPTNGEISFRFLLQDVNRSRGASVAVFRLSRGDETVWTEAVSTSGSRDSRPDHVYEKVVRSSNLVAGIYRLSFVADSNVFIRRISTTARHWVIGPRVTFGDNAGYSTSTPSVAVWTNSRHLIAQTFHPEGLQIASLGGARVTLSKTHEWYALDRLSSELNGDRQLLLPRGDAQLVGDGYAAFFPDALFLPTPRRLTDTSHPLEEGILAVLTPYQPPDVASDGWLRLHSSFDISDARNSLKFTLSAPGIATRDGAVDIRAAELVYQRPALSGKEWWQTLRNELADAWRRL